MSVSTIAREDGRHDTAFQSRQMSSLGKVQIRKSDLFIGQLVRKKFGMLAASCICIQFNWEDNPCPFGRGKQCSTDLFRFIERINELESVVSDLPITMIWKRK